MYKSIGIQGIGYATGSRVVSNKEISELSGIDENIIQLTSGLVERRWALEHESFSTFAIEAGRKAIEDAGIIPEEIDLLIIGTTMDDYVVPASGCLIQHELGLGKAMVVNTNEGCAAPIYTLSVAGHIMNSNSQIRHALVICGDVGSRILNYEQNIMTGMLADGASAVVLGRLKEGYEGFLAEQFEASGQYFYGSGIFGKGCRIPQPGEPSSELFIMNTEVTGSILVEVMKWFKESFYSCIEMAGVEKKDVKLISPHTANIGQIKNQLDAIDEDITKTHIVTDRLGHCGGGTQFIVFKEARKANKIKNGDIVFSFGNASGFQHGGILFRWNDKENFV